MFRAVRKSGEGFFKDRGSKFYAFARAVQNEGEVKLELHQLRETYPDARHICYAFILGANQEKYRANDDGEPSNSAGTPILGQIRSNGLTNTLVAVVRYSSGTKLGVPGLIEAYKESANDAISNSTCKPFQELSLVTIQFDYEQSGLVDQLLNLFEEVQIEKTFGEKCVFQIQISKSDFVRFREEAMLRRIDLI